MLLAIDSVIDSECLTEWGSKLNSIKNMSWSSCLVLKYLLDLFQNNYIICSRFLYLIPDAGYYGTVWASRSARRVTHCTKYISTAHWLTQCNKFATKKLSLLTLFFNREENVTSHEAQFTERRIISNMTGKLQ